MYSNSVYLKDIMPSPEKEEEDLMQGIWTAKIHYDESGFIDQLESLGVPEEYREAITAIVVKCCNGDIFAAWCSESNIPYCELSRFHPLPFYKDEKLDKAVNLPEYWSHENPEYQTK